MWTESTIYKEDLENIIKDQNIPWAELDGKTILITGATGLIGMNIVNSILYYGTGPPWTIIRDYRQTAGHSFCND